MNWSFKVKCFLRICIIFEKIHQWKISNFKKMLTNITFFTEKIFKIMLLTEKLFFWYLTLMDFVKNYAYSQNIFYPQITVHRKENILCSSAVRCFLFTGTVPVINLFLYGMEISITVRPYFYLKQILI